MPIYTLNFSSNRDMKCRYCERIVGGQKGFTSPQYSQFVILRASYQLIMGGEIFELPRNTVSLNASLELPSAGGEYVYELAAVLVHTGSYVPNAGGALGHYYVYMKTPAGWARCDDGSVSAAAESEVLTSDWSRVIYQQKRMTAQSIDFYLPVY